MSSENSSCNISNVEKYASDFDSDLEISSDGTFVGDFISSFDKREAESSVSGSYTEMNDNGIELSVDGSNLQTSDKDTSTKQSNQSWKAPETHYYLGNGTQVPYTCPKTRGESCTHISHRPSENFNWQDEYLSPSDIEHRDAVHHAQRRERIRRMNMSTGEKVEEFIRNVPNDCRSTFKSCKSKVISAIHNLTGGETDGSDHTT